MNLERLENVRLSLRESSLNQKPKPYENIGELITSIGVGGLATEILLQQNPEILVNAALVITILTGVFLETIPNYPNK